MQSVTNERSLKIFTLLIAFVCCVTFGRRANATDCHQVMVQAPTPFLGNNDEIVKLSDGSLWQVKFEYLYLYQYYPQAIICPGLGKLIVDGKSISVAPISLDGSSSGSAASPVRGLTVIYAKSGCHDYFVAKGESGFYVLEWYGGHNPSEGDTILSTINSYGMKDILYSNGSEGRVWVDEYDVSVGTAARKLSAKCH